MGIVGILVSAHVFRNIKSGNTGNEKIHLYNKAAIKHGLTPVYLCLERIFPSSGTAHGYKYLNGIYKYVKCSIPRVIHNRSMPQSKRFKKRLKRLSRTSIVFNSQNRYSKYYLHNLLKHKFASNLPITIHYTKSNLRKMMKNYNSLYLKPRSSSLGRGIIKISENKRIGKWKLQMYKGSMMRSKFLAEKQVNIMVNNKRYIIQESIPLAKYKGNPYDIRVTVQRGIDGHWHVTGMFGKIARTGSHVTNVARGGRVKKCNPLFKHSMQDPTKVRITVKNLSLDIIQYLSNRIYRLADVGLDIGVNAQGKPYFIELNCRDQRYGFNKAKMLKTFYHTYENPILYAKYLLMNREAR